MSHTPERRAAELRARETVEARCALIAHRPLSEQERAQCLADVLYAEAIELGDLGTTAQYAAVQLLLRRAVASSYQKGWAAWEHRGNCEDLGAALVGLARITAAPWLNGMIAEAQSAERQAWRGEPESEGAR